MADGYVEGAELARRLKAARELRGLSQTDLGELFDADGLNRSDPGQIERLKVTLRRSHVDGFIRHLRVPERWFTADSVDEIVGLEATPETQLSWIAEQMEALRVETSARVLEVLTRLDAMQRREDPPQDQPPP